MTKQQLLIHKNLTLAKGITWLTSELSDSLLFKSDDLTLSKINQLKNIMSWEEGKRKFIKNIEVLWKEDETYNKT